MQAEIEDLFSSVEFFLTHSPNFKVSGCWRISALDNYSYWDFHFSTDISYLQINAREWHILLEQTTLQAEICFFKMRISLKYVLNIIVILIIIKQAKWINTCLGIEGNSASLNASSSIPSQNYFLLCTLSFHNTTHR